MDINRCCNKFFFNQLIGVIPTDTCPTIIGEYNSIDNSPNGTYVGQLAVERYIDNEGTQHIHLYEWDGADWVQMIDSNAKLADNLFVAYIIDNISTGWEVTVDAGANWYNSAGEILFDPPVASITVWFRNLENGCVYTNLPLLPLSYCTDWAIIDGGENFFFFGTVNGITPPDQAGILATMGEPYQSVQGAFGGVVYGAGSNTIYLQVSRPTGSAVTASLATVLDQNGDPVSAVPTNTTCNQECQSVNWTPVAPVSTIVVRGITINGVDINLGATTLHVDEAGLVDEIIAIMQTDCGIYDPTLTMTIYCSGNTVFFQVSSVLDFSQLTWQNDTNTEGGSETITPC